MCKRKSGRLNKKHTTLLEGFRKAEQRYGKEKVSQLNLVGMIVDMEPRSTPEAAVSHLVFAALRLHVLREEKWGGAGSIKRIVRGEKFDALGSSIFCGYYDDKSRNRNSVDDNSDSGADLATDCE